MNEHLNSASEDTGSERAASCAEFGSECEDLRTEILAARVGSESLTPHQANVERIQPFIEDRVDESFPNLPSPRQAAALLKPETAEMVAGLFDHLSGEGYPDWLVRQAVTITSTVRSQEYTVHLYNQYIAEAQAEGNAAGVARWQNIRRRLERGDQVSHTTGRKVDIVVSNGRLNRLSEFWNDEGIFKSVESFFNSGEAAGFSADFHGGHFDVTPTTSYPRDEPFRTNDDLNQALSEAVGADDEPASQVRAAQLVPGVQAITGRIRDGRRPVQASVQRRVESEPVVEPVVQARPEAVDLVEGLDLSRPIKVDSSVIQTRLNLRSRQNPNSVLQKATANQTYECTQPAVVKTGSELGITNSDLADLKFVCLDTSQGEAWAWIEAFRQELPSPSDIA